MVLVNSAPQSGHVALAAWPDFSRWWRRRLLNVENWRPLQPCSQHWGLGLLWTTRTADGPSWWCGAPPFCIMEGMEYIIEGSCLLPESVKALGEHGFKLKGRLTGSARKCSSCWMGCTDIRTDTEVADTDWDTPSRWKKAEEASAAAASWKKAEETSKAAGPSVVPA